MEHSAYVKTLGVFSLLQIVMLSLILQMLKNGQSCVDGLKMSRQEFEFLGKSAMLAKSKVNVAKQVHSNLSLENSTLTWMLLECTTTVTKKPLLGLVAVCPYFAIL
ncbi:unnamed protein product, partial [Vitis vinifera]|uniref:Uncharacterized protein n=1 Tax=Vitis vinifera TaxID=29760 RepID=D7U6H5_VITVI